ncbi:hypothetical protein CORC01_07267 [Colletotrichum orchidophilum]|uniref:Uncharacterized protein n=1 Tax=Colletotrichum orchidophilum TaxID=1209926 RepID=A0A1G4B889_9PEZI|nr:uncharacterized protein CORC01_07267 [Colletotrichum orchidophilum]OHE97485.1 hypothetical protein CORC01_07267 [Colletotrichum orchidophilum]
MTSYTDVTAGAVSGKLSKSRSKPVVKPILKKLSHSEKNSLDLDRGWDEQQTMFGNYGSSLGGSSLGREREGSFGGRDVSFSISATELHHSGSINNGRSKFSHARSTSGTSHVSVATSGSGQRNGSFVHPFQQTPRTSSPPLSYANSLTSIEHANSNSNSNTNISASVPAPRDYSPTITEDDDDLLDHQYLHHRSNYHAPASSSIPITSNPSSTSYPRRPSLASRTSSLSDINNQTSPPSLRINTSRTNSNNTSSRLVHVSSHSDINIPAGRLSESAAPSTAPVLSPLSSASPSTSVTAMSPLRTSLEGFRLRSRSELDSNYHQERIRQERRRWEEKERLKSEKRDKEDMRKRERADIKEAQRHEREQQQMLKREAKEAARKQSFSHSTRNSSSDIIRPSISRKKTGPDAEKLAMGAQGDVGFASRNYESTDQGQAPVADELILEGPRRSQTAKRKTQGAWTSFVLWFRTRILRLHNNMAKK